MTDIINPGSGNANVSAKNAKAIDISMKKSTFG
jgi:hypothetical protein